MDEKLYERLWRCGVVAVLTVDQVRRAVPLAKALLDGGVEAMELTLRTPAAIDCLKAIVDEVPQMLPGVGTILTPRQAAEAKAAGAAFGVAPGCNRRVIEAARAEELPFAPGVATPSDLEQAVEAGCRLLKFFPAEPSGGLAYLRSMAGPYAHLGLRFIPLGGLRAGHLETYLSDGLITAVGGSWLAPKELLVAEDWAGIRSLAGEAASIVREHRPAAAGGQAAPDPPEGERP